MIGTAQALALFPGVSRSGATISAGMFAGLSREMAARFSFLLSAPIVVAAGMKELPEIRHAADEGVSTAALVSGVSVASVSGLLAMHLLLRLVAVRSLRVFVWYRIGLAAVILAMIAVQ
jgi:undecaprenyl-diphosphatase